VPDLDPTDHQVAEQIAKFDRHMGFYKAAAEASRSAEDAYLEAEAAPALREESRRLRRWLVLSSVAAILASVFDVTPTQVEALGLDLSGAKGNIVVVGIGLFTLYFLIEFLAFARRDYGYWHRRVAVAHRRLWAALQLESGQIKVQPCGNPTFRSHYLQDVDARQSEYAKAPPTAPNRIWLVDHCRTFSGWVEVIIPVAIAALALAALLWTLAA
jgi:hypothetical protein